MVFLHISISDEDMSSLDIEATLDGSSLLLAPNNTGIISIDISDVGVGSHSLKIIITDSLGQESRLSSTFLVHYPYEDPTIIIVDDNEISIQAMNNCQICNTPIFCFNILTSGAFI